jgi:hypothetical protein
LQRSECSKDGPRLGYGESATLRLANRKINETSNKHERSGPGADCERVPGFHPKFRMGGEQTPGQSVGRQSASDSKSEAENEIALKSH